MKVKTTRVKFKWVAPSLSDPTFHYRSSADTNVQDAWRRHGWVPPSSLRQTFTFFESAKPTNT